MDSLREEYSGLEKIKVWFGRKSVVVFTMGKVGTLTICNSLRKIGYRHVHPHSLRFTRPGIHFLKVPLSATEKKKYFIRTLLKRIKVWVWKLCKREILIITGVRDPYSRNLSAYFEQVHYLGGINSSATPDQVRDLFEQTCDFDAPLNWFDDEVLKVTGINVYDYPFDINKGISIIKKGKYKLLVFRVDKLNSLETEISEFLYEEKFKVLSTNSSDNGDYSVQSKTLRDSYKYDTKLAKHFTNSKYMNHFFDAQEIEELEARWSNPSIVNG
ncbi:MAG: hypothetical protein ACJAS1_002584 [Oleiphilaceae bacterium]